VEGVSARIAAHPGPRPSISLGIELENAGTGEWAATILEPVVPWDLRAWVGDEEVRVRQPELDLGVRPRRVSLAPGERTELASPIVLIFEEDGERPDSAFVWVLATPPVASVDLQATVTAGGEQLQMPRTTVRLP
jgi:hypothetical protein